MPGWRHGRLTSLRPYSLEPAEQFPGFLLAAQFHDSVAEMDQDIGVVRGNR